jgi:hypothetical protein
MQATDQTQTLESSIPDRVERFLNVIVSVPSSLSGLEYAYAACLTPSELFVCLERSIRAAHARHVLLNAIDKHPSADEIKRLASAFAQRLLQTPRSRYSDVQAINYCLNRLFLHLDEEVQAIVIAFWLSDRYADSKKRVISLVSKSLSFGGTEIILAYWKKTGDRLALKHLIYDTPLEWLRDNFEDFLGFDIEPWLISKLFLRLSQILPGIIERAREQDPITYLYLCAKTGKKISDNEAKELFFNNLEEERRGLALWAIGTMGCWSALEYITSCSEEISQIDEATFVARYEALRNPTAV